MGQKTVRSEIASKETRQLKLRAKLHDSIASQRAVANFLAKLSPPSHVTPAAIVPPKFKRYKRLGGSGAFQC
jgi:hypothetical protein